MQAINPTIAPTMVMIAFGGQDLYKGRLASAITCRSMLFMASWIRALSILFTKILYTSLVVATFRDNSTYSKPSLESLIFIFMSRCCSYLYFHRTCAVIFTISLVSSHLPPKVRSHNFTDFYSYKLYLYLDYSLFSYLFLHLF